MRETFHAEHGDLLASYEALRRTLAGVNARLKPLGDTDYYQHHVFSNRAGSMLNYLQPAVELAEAAWYEAAFATCRAALEHHFVDTLLFLADRYRRKLPDVTAEEYKRLRASRAAREPGTEDIIDLNYDATNRVLSIVRSGIHVRGGERGPDAMSLSVYYRVMDDFRPFRVPRSTRSYVRHLVELPDDVVVRHLRAHADAWFQQLRWDAIKDNLVMNQLCTRRETAHLDVHYSFLGAYVHPVSPHAMEAVRGARSFQPSYDHYASELVLLYAVALAVRELEAFRRMADREPVVEVRDWEEDVVPVLSLARERAAHLWFVGDEPPLFDREEDATYRNRRNRVPQPVTFEQAQAIPNDEVRYYENPLRRLKEMHRAARGYPWLLYRSPWPRGDAFSFF
jgi:hypothetical protein